MEKREGGLEIGKNEGDSGEIKIPMRYFFTGIGVVVLIALFFVLQSGALTGFLVSGGGVSEDEVEARVLDFFETEVPDGNAEIESISKEESFYRVNLIFEGEPFPVYVTLDGNFMSVDVIPLTE